MQTFPDRPTPPARVTLPPDKLAVFNQIGNVINRWAVGQVVRNSVESGTIRPDKYFDSRAIISKSPKSMLDDSVRLTWTVNPANSDQIQGVDLARIQDNRVNGIISELHQPNGDRQYILGDSRDLNGGNYVELSFKHDNSVPTLEFHGKKWETDPDLREAKVILGKQSRDRMLKENVVMQKAVAAADYIADENKTATPAGMIRVFTRLGTFIT